MHDQRCSSNEWLIKAASAPRRAIWHYAIKPPSQASHFNYTLPWVITIPQGADSVHLVHALTKDFRFRNPSVEAVRLSGPRLQNFSYSTLPSCPHWRRSAYAPPPFNNCYSGPGRIKSTPAPHCGAPPPPPPFNKLSFLKNPFKNSCFGRGRIKSTAALFGRIRKWTDRDPIV